MSTPPFNTPDANPTPPWGQQPSPAPQVQPGWQPPTGAAASAPTGPTGPKWWTKRWVQFLAVFILGAILGGIGGNSGASDAEKRATAAEAKVSAAEKQASDAQAAASQAQADAQQQIAALAKQKASLDARAKAIGGAEAAAKANQFDGTGTYIVGTDIKPGTYRAAASPGCYWERLKNLSGGFDGIIANGNEDGPFVVKILASDKGFHAQDCGTFKRI